MTLPSIEFVLGNNIIVMDLEILNSEEFDGTINDEIIRDFPEDINIKAHPRKDRPDKQQIFINNTYYMSVPCAKYNKDEDLQDPYNFYGEQFIYLIKELYKRGYCLNNIKIILNIILEGYYRLYTKPQY